MSSIKNTVNTKPCYLVIMFLCFLFTILAFSPHGFARGSTFSAQPYKYNASHTLKLPSIDNKKWLQVTAKPGKKPHYFASNSDGQIYLIELGNEQHSILLLDMQKHSTTTKKILGFNAITLHPNFALKDEQGYQTFYTAHTEASNNNVSTLRIEDHKSTVNSRFDAVITAWQLNSNNKVEIVSNAQREVVRISLTDVNNSVTQLSFHPDRKPWDADFGLLYIAFSATEALANIPLYSGVILRIDPNQFGLRSYTVPTSNPYIRNVNINDNIFVLGAQQVQQFIWPKKHANQLLISHHYKNEKLTNGTTQQLLSLSIGGEDWRDIPPQEVIYQSSNLLKKNSILSYRGRDAKNLHNKILMLHSQPQWQLNSLLLHEEQAQNNTGDDQITHEWNLPDNIAKDSSLIMLQNSDAEILFLQTDTGAIHQLSQSTTTTPTTQKAANSSGIVIYLLLTLLTFAVALFIFYRINLNKLSAKAFVRKQYARMALNEDSSKVVLYKRHHKQSSRTITLSNITSCQIILGDTIINTIDSINAKHGFNEQLEQSLRAVFQREQTDKMVDGKIRKINLCISEPKKINAVVCLYLRKGSDRITKKTYFDVVDELIDWCWLIAQTINKNNTSVRPVIKSNTPNENADSETYSNEAITKQENVILDIALDNDNNKSLHQQADIIRPATHEISQLVDSSVENIAISPNKHGSIEQASTVNTPHDKTMDTSGHASGIVDAELVNALEKLVQLNKQGFLTQVEFSQAKAKLLSSLIDS